MRWLTLGRCISVGATATANGHSGTISDSAWSYSPIALGSSGSYDVSFGAGGIERRRDSLLALLGRLLVLGDWQQNATDTSGTGGSTGGSGDGGYGNGGYGYGGYPGGDGGYGKAAVRLWLRPVDTVTVAMATAGRLRRLGKDG